MAPAAHGARRRGGTVATFRGSCHCGRVRFEVDAEPTALTSCSCSICARKGALYLRVKEVAAVRVLSGESDLGTYRFHTGTAVHHFCRHCGIHPFHRPRIAPERWSVNARCLDDFDLAVWPVVRFDGRHWEASARAEGWRGSSSADSPEPGGRGA
jgi:hypothetical protein